MIVVIIVTHEVGDIVEHNYQLLNVLILFADNFFSQRGNSVSCLNIWTMICGG